MKNFLRGKFTTALVVIATIILAGVAIYTAIRLYNLRRQNISLTGPEGSFAWDCSKYVFSVSSSGIVSVKNSSSKDEPVQQAKVYINGSLVATLDVPALPYGQSATLGTVQVPSGGFSWKVEGTKDCSNSGTVANACKLLTFTIKVSSPTLTPTLPPGTTATLTPTVNVTPAPSATLTPTVPPVGGISSTPTPTVTPTLPPGQTATVSPTRAPSNTPTSSGQIAAASPTPPGGATLPDAGSSLMTIATFGLGVVLITFALLIAL